MKKVGEDHFEKALDRATKHIRSTIEVCFFVIQRGLDMGSLEYHARQEDLKRKGISNFQDCAFLIQGFNRLRPLPAEIQSRIDVILEQEILKIFKGMHVMLHRPILTVFFHILPHFTTLNSVFNSFLSSFFQILILSLPEGTRPSCLNQASGRKAPNQRKRTSKEAYDIFIQRCEKNFDLKTTMTKSNIEIRCNL